MRVLIIGASSFLGGHVLREALATGHDAVTAGRSAVPASASHHQLNLSADSLPRIAEAISSIAPHAVINCAGATSGAPDVLAAANITAVHALAAVMIRSRSAARLVHIGSAAEYGRSERGRSGNRMGPAPSRQRLRRDQARWDQACRAGPGGRP